MQDFKWSSAEKKIARRAFDTAYEREMKRIGIEVRSMFDVAQDARAVWRIHDYLTEKREETDEKYDYRYSVLITVFARLIADGYLQTEELQGLRDDKMGKIRQIAQFIQDQE